MKKAILISLAILLIFVIIGQILKYQRNKVTVSNDIIHHPVYGDYPKVVEFKQGMDLMPGQTAIFNLPISLPVCEGGNQ